MIRLILVPKVRHLRDLHNFSSVTSHELSIQLSVEGELRQHDDVMTVTMMLPEQGFTKAPLRYERGGLWWRGELHTAKKSMTNLCVYGVPPSPVYKGMEEGEGAGLPPCSFIYGGRGHPKTHKLIIDLLAVCGAPLHHNPPRSYRRSA